MPNNRRIRRVGSVRQELLSKAREAALAAVQIHNTPQILFKAELFIVTMVIAWTYLLHAYCRQQAIEYRYFQQKGQRRSFDRTKSGAYKYWELERCLNDEQCPLDADTRNNLRFLIGIRHEIEHQMTTRIDHFLTAKFQACCLNFNRYAKQLFGEEHGLEQHLTFSLQLSSLSREQLAELDEHPELPPHIATYLQDFEAALTEQEYQSQSYAYRVLFVQKTANHRNQADEVIEFVRADSDLSQKVNATYAVIKETEKPKYLPSQVVRLMVEEGHDWFGMYGHTELWQALDAQDPAKGYGTRVAKQWYWYERWVDVVREHCQRETERRAGEATARSTGGG